MKRLIFSNCFWWILVAATTSVCGCKQKPSATVRTVTLRATSEQSSPFDDAMAFLNQLEQFQPQQASEEILNNLRQWSREQKDSVEWSADPMFARLPKEFGEIFRLDRLSTSEFLQHDAFVLQEAVWCRDVALSIAKRPDSDAEFETWLESAVRNERISHDDAQDLSLAYRLFDWTVRNIQLDPEVEDVDYLGGPSAIAKRTEDTLRHIYYPGENLLLGHGDWLERSRVFILLARQVGIHVVMLVADKGEGLRPQNWVTAAIIGDELYLFDALLGLPLPSADDAGIGTLSEYVDNPALLESLTIDGQRYRISAKDLQNLSAGIDATPSYLSQRMKIVESKLLGDQKLKLTVAPTPLARAKLRSSKGINQVMIWTHPYESYRFFFALQQLQQSRGPNDPFEAIEIQRYEEHRPYDRLGHLLTGRLQQFRGHHSGGLDDPGATQHYMQARMPDAEMVQFDLRLDQQPKDSPFLVNLPDEKEAAARLQQYEARMRALKSLAILSKRCASYFLGQIALDNSDYKVAASYFDKRVLKADSESPWIQGAKFGLGRAYEAIGRRDKDEVSLQKAIELYEKDETTPQRPGNLIRAKRLKQLINSSN